MGQFMKLLPVTLIIVLTSSLVNALLFTPVLSKLLIKKEENQKVPNKKRNLIWAGSLILAGILFYFLHVKTLANLLIASALTLLLYAFVLYNTSIWFQYKFLIWLEQAYKKFIKFSLRGKNPIKILGIVTLLLFITLGFYFGVRKPKMILFPNNEPSYINIYTKLPYGVDIEYTDSTMKVIEKDLNNKLAPYSNIIESILVNVGSGVREDRKFSVGKNYNMGQFTINFVDFEDRNKISTSDIISELSDYFKNRYPGVEFKIEKNKMGPPSGKPIQIELNGEDFDKLIALSDSIIYKIENSNIPGIENLALDIETNKPNIIIHVDKDKAGRFGLKTAQIASAIRTSIYGTEASKYKSGDDEYPIMIRFAKDYRNNINTILNQDISFRNTKGKLVNIPISSVASISMNNSYDAIKHIDTKRTLTISSNVIEGYNSNQINNLIETEIAKIEMPDGYSVKFGGEQEDMKESMNFLSTALLIAIILILVILVTQFNSVIKPLIIIASVGLSTIGVFGGLATFNMDFVIMMTGIGIISLAGIVVNNAIVLIDYIDFLKLKRKRELGLDEDENLPIDESISCIEEAGLTRLRPVLLTALQLL